MTEKNKTRLEVCTSCGKPRRIIRKGTLTSWMFQSETCLCPILVEIDEQGAEERPGTRAPRRIRSRRDPTSQLHLGDRFKILEQLGDGGMGTVYKVQDLSINEVLAVKVLNPVFARDYSKKRRFIREVKALEQLDHSNIVTVYGYGEARNGLPFMVMEYIPGVTLSERLRQLQSLPFKDAMPIFYAITEALEAAHFQGVIHRDLKPSNIMLVEEPGQELRVKIVDFGISKLRQEGTHRTTNLTQTGEIFGSPFYMSPEQCQGEEIDKRSDVYSLGCVMYEALTGRPPFHGGNPVGIIMSHLKEKPKPFIKVKRDHNVPPLVEAVIMQCLDKSPQKRLQSMKEVRDSLEAAQNARPVFTGAIKKGRFNYTPIISVLLLCLVAEVVFVLDLHGKLNLPWQTFGRALGWLPSRAGETGQPRSFYQSWLASSSENVLDQEIAKGNNIGLIRLNGAKIVGRKYVGINVHGATFTDCDLSGSEFVDCDFSYTSFYGSRVIGAIFQNCNMEYAKFDRSTTIAYSRFINSPMKNVQDNGYTATGVTSDTPESWLRFMDKNQQMIGQRLINAASDQERIILYNKRELEAFRESPSTKQRLNSASVDNRVNQLQQTIYRAQVELDSVRERQRLLRERIQPCLTH